jgi:tellurite resistance protein TerC/cation:H+ antiporter
MLKSSGRFVWRLGVLVVGLITLIAGIIMIFTPGPAVVFIPAGLAILATEFEWARRILRRVRPLIDAAIEEAKRKKEEVQARRNAKKARSTATAADTDQDPTRTPVGIDSSSS